MVNSTTQAHEAPDSPAPSTVAHDSAPDSPPPPDHVAQHRAMDVLHTLDALAKSYDDAYMSCADALGKTIDHSFALDNHRTETVTALQHDVADCAAACAEARDIASDQSAMRQARKDLEDLEDEQTALVQQIVGFQSDIAELRTQVSSTEREIRNVRATLEHKEADFQQQFPTARFIHKILRNVSGAQVVPRGDDGVIQGVILKGRNRDMVPFFYDDTATQYDAVNTVWSSILA